LNNGHLRNGKETHNSNGIKDIIKENELHANDHGKEVNNIIDITTIFDEKELQTLKLGLPKN
jgi:hypothetical protein